MLPYAANRGVNGQGALGNSIMSCWGHSVQSAVPTLVKVILTADFVVKRCQQEFVLVSSPVFFSHLQHFQGSP